MVVLPGDMYGHVGSSNFGYDWTHGGLGMEIGMQMDPGSWSLQMTKPSHLQHFVHEAGTPVGDLCSCFC